jgi:acyl dehydratase
MASQTLYFEDIEIGDDIGPIDRAITHEQVLDFIECWTGRTEPSRFNDHETAVREGLAGPIVPGIMAMGFISRLLTEWASGGKLTMLDVVFRQVVLHDVVHTLSGIITDKSDDAGIECDVFLQDPQGTRLIIGKATLDLPTKG